MEDFRASFKNHRCAHGNFLKGKEVKQKLHNAHSGQVNHNGEDYWKAQVIDQVVDKADTVKKFSERESFWQHELYTS